MTFTEIINNSKEYQSDKNAFWKRVGISEEKDARIMKDPKNMLNISQIEKIAYILKLKYSEVHDAVRFSRDNRLDMTMKEIKRIKHLTPEGRNQNNLKNKFLRTQKINFDELLKNI